MFPAIGALVIATQAASFHVTAPVLKCGTQSQCHAASYAAHSSALKGCCKLNLMSVGMLSWLTTLDGAAEFEAASDLARLQGSNCNAEQHETRSTAPPQPWLQVELTKTAKRGDIWRFRAVDGSNQR